MTNTTAAKEEAASEGSCPKTEGPSGEEVVTRYEQLRREVIGDCGNGCRPCETGHGLGWALLLRRGMAAWMQAWPKTSPPAGTDRLGSGRHTAIGQPTLDSEITMVLTNMAVYHIPSLP